MVCPGSAGIESSSCSARYCFGAAGCYRNEAIKPCDASMVRRSHRRHRSNRMGQRRGAKKRKKQVAPGTPPDEIPHTKIQPCAPLLLQDIAIFSVAVKLRTGIPLKLRKVFLLPVNHRFKARQVSKAPWSAPSFVLKSACGVVKDGPQQLFLKKKRRFSSGLEALHLQEQ